MSVGAITDQHLEELHEGLSIISNHACGWIDWPHLVMGI